MMAVKVYNKLVRDKIPTIIEADGKKCETEILSDDEYIKMLDVKLDEELENVRLAKVKKRGAFREKVFLKEVVE